jgi:hypothetical protein
MTDEIGTYNKSQVYAGKGNDKYNAITAEKNASRNVAASGAKLHNISI